MPAFICILLLLLLLCFPELSVRGAADGLALWLFTLVPTFFPFLFLSNLMVLSGAAEEISNIFGHIFCPVFHVSVPGAYIIFMGFLCGYPMGAKLTAEFVKTGRILPEEGRRLLAFCNNPSPMFLAGFVLADCMKEPYSSVGTLAMFYLAPVLTGILVSGRLFSEKAKNTAADNERMIHLPDFEPVSFPQNGTVMERIRASMWDAFETLLYLGGYVILFRIASALILWLAGYFPANSYPVFCLLAASMEMTGGAACLAASGMSSDLINLFVPLCVIFGGGCITAQTAGLLTGSGLSLRTYIKGKILQITIAAGLYLVQFLL